MRTLLTILVFLAGCGPGPVAQIGSVDEPAVQIGSKLSPALQVDPNAVSVRLVASESPLVQLGDPNGPLLEVRPGALAVNVAPGAMSIQTTVPMPDLTVPAIVLGGLILAAVVVQVLANNFLAKKRMTYGKRMGMAQSE